MTEQQLNEQRGRIASLLKSRREYLQMTWQDVSDKTDGRISARTVQRAEGGYWLNVQQLVRICHALEINIADTLEKKYGL